MVCDVRFGSKADIGEGPTDVRFTPESGHRNSVVECPLCAKSRHSALRKETSLFFTDDRLDKESLPLSAARLQTEGLKIKDSYSAK